MHAGHGPVATSVSWQGSGAVALDVPRGRAKALLPSVAPVPHQAQRVSLLQPHDLQPVHPGSGGVARGTRGPAELQLSSPGEATCLEEQCTTP